ncbi:hypothetical protein ACHAXR_007317 [Thalassiosira sp. AJA248-18]
MRILLLLSLSLLSKHAVVAFQTAPRAPAPETRLRMSQQLGNDPQGKPTRKLIIPSTSKLSKLSTFQLSALTQLKKDERNKFNRQRLLKMGVTMTAFFLATLTKSNIARAATPLIVTHGAISPLIYAPPGLGIVEMPGMRGVSPYEMGRLPNQGVVMLSLALFITTALLRSAGEGRVRLMHFMTKYLGKMIKEDEKKKEEIELGLPKEMDWDTYSHSMLDPLQKKHTEKSSDHVFDKRTMLFDSIKSKTEVDQETEDTKLREANRFFLEQKYKQHHHPVHVAHTKYEKSNYLDTLPINEEEKHDMPKGYLDTLSNAKKSTWGVYKHQLDEAKPLNEVDELKQDVSSLHSLLQIEQSMYQTSNQALKLAMDAQNGELHHSSTNDELKEFDRKLSTNEELKEFDKKAQEYEKTVMKDAAKVSKTKEGEKTGWV